MLVEAPLHLPPSPWLIRQRWEHLLFAHWPVEPRLLERHLPRGVDPDVAGGAAWVALVAFVMTKTRSCASPAPVLPPIPELNLRTYVRVGGVPAVWFLTLDATSPLFVGVGRALYGLRYRRARMVATEEGGTLHYVSCSARTTFAASYRPLGEPAPPVPGSLEHFLVERYRLFGVRRGRLVTATVEHPPWPLQRAEAEIHARRVSVPLPLDAEPLAHYCRGVDARISLPRAVAPAARGRSWIGVGAGG